MSKQSKRNTQKNIAKKKAKRNQIGKEKRKLRIQKLNEVSKDKKRLKKTRQGRGNHTKYTATSRNSAKKRYRGQGR